MQENELNYKNYKGYYIIITTNLNHLLLFNQCDQLN